MNFFAMFRSAIKAHWAFSLVIGGNCVYHVVTDSQWASRARADCGYEFAVVIIGALGTKAVMAASMRAFPTMMS